MMTSPPLGPASSEPAITDSYAPEIDRLRLDLRALAEASAQKGRDLERELQFERDRGAALEFIARNEPLETVLESVLDLLDHQAPGIAAGIFVPGTSGLTLVAVRGVPAEARRRLQAPPPNLDPFRRTLLAHGWQACAVEPAVASDGRVLGIVAAFGCQGGDSISACHSVLSEVARLTAVALEHQKVYEALAYQADHDTLTSLPNRVSFHDSMRQALGSARRRRHKAALLRLDLDDFKQVNDMFGHRAGDALLRQIARRLRSAVRAADTVARMGSDEFAILLHEVDSAEGAAQAAEKIRSVLSAPIAVRGQKFNATASIGISLFPDHATEPRALLGHADTALYAAQVKGGNRYHFFEPAADAHIHERFELEFQLRRALEQNEFHLCYQPQYDAGSFRITGVEALLRWTNPVVGFPSPERFIPAAESLGLIVPIGRWVLEEACRQAVRWAEAGFVLRMAVNVSAVQFARPDFTQSVLQIVSQTGMDPRLLELELTESCLVADPELAGRQMAALRAAGIRMSLDDFGTGYSCLKSLHTLPLDALKIDRSFIRDLGTETANARLVEAVVRLAQSLRLTVVAEGVENHRQLAALSDMGCEYVQGFLFEKPHPPQSIQDLLAGTGVWAQAAQYQ